MDYEKEYHHWYNRCIKADEINALLLSACKEVIGKIELIRNPKPLYALKMKDILEQAINQAEKGA